MLAVLLATSTINAQTKKISINESQIFWTGKKITGEHVGTLKFREGQLTFKNRKLIGGNFIVDMTSLANNDQTGKDKIKLEDHLKSSDFFDIENFKISRLVFKKVVQNKSNSYTINADLTIKGKTNPVLFVLRVDGKKASANLKIDRTKFGIQYGSGSFFDDLGDRTIYDEFDLKVNLKF